MGILDRLLRRSGKNQQAAHNPQVDEIAARILELNPQLRLLPQYRARISPAVGTALEYVYGLVASLPPARDASAATWSSDPYIHAFFATPDDVAQILSRSNALHEYFAQDMDADVAYAVLGMAMIQSNVLGVAQSGDHVRTDVRQTTVSFSDHQVRVCAPSDDALRRQVVPRVVDQLVMEGLARSAEDKSRRDMLEEERALLKARLQLRERQGTGMRGVLGHDGAANFAETAGLQEKLNEIERRLAALGFKTETLERALDYMCDVLADPASHLVLSTVKLRLNRMNVVTEGQLGEEIELRLGGMKADPSNMRAFAIIRFARAELVARRSFDEAARFVI